MPESLYDDPGLYDLVMGHNPQMVAFYTEQVRRPGLRVLDLGCGTGRFSLPMAAAGGVVTGLDIAPGMLARARQAAEAAGLAIDFRVGDMRNFAFAEPFDVITIAANSLLHMTGPGELRRVFDCARRHLAPGGRLVFDIFVPSIGLLAASDGPRQPLGVFGEISIEEALDYDPIAQVLQSDWYWSRPDAPEFRVTRLAMRQVFPEEVPLLAELAGLKIMARYGDFDASPFRAGSRRQVCVLAAA